MERWQRIDCAPAAEAAGELRICCGAERWVSRMLARRPFGSLEAARAAAREEWFALSTDDWKQAFVHHPRIGDRSALRARFGEAAAVSSAREQSGISGADGVVLQRLLESNREYESRFGYLFIVCATGKTAEQMLQILRERLTNHPDEEMLIAAAEHAKICDSRLAAVV
ncbi:MAG TPA: 2-oxo-4-hydroxy-4-carboxy-5-ureidoimidazoline decarboxylase [Vicinamibacterales bacterium]|jgi:2-oxo-4-hydroxy-4-carboxy-5-ureidoimidazoline decarboxylase|nr:2-oxo-4-hydroxy-4-carboxy-5-ureidoimidazoline decarboxylase [Vicinamibacterales bacterium]